MNCPLYDHYEELRAGGPVVKEGDVWQVLGYEECAHAQRHEEVFAHPDREDLVGDAEALAGIQEIVGGKRSLLLLQGEPHRILHRRMSQSLARDTDHYRERTIAPLIAHFISNFGARAEVEFFDEFCEHLPAAVIAGVLGLPWREDLDLLRRTKEWNDAIARCRSSFGISDETVREGREAAANLDAVLAPIVRERRTAPEEDYISSLWPMGEDIFADWGEADVLAQARLLFFAGSNTTGHFLANLVYVLASHDDIRQRLREQPDLIPGFTEEVLRVYPPAQFRPRVVVEDTELSGVQLHAGDRIYAVNGAANRDPSRYGSPSAIDIGVSRKKGHLSFNVGPRTCPGAPLARAEGYETVRALLSSFVDVQLSPDAPPPVLEGTVHASFRPLWIRLINAE